jgi:hypothetical protein
MVALCNRLGKRSAPAKRIPVISMTCREFIASPRNSPRKAQLLIGGDVNTAACGLFAACARIAARAGAS